MLLRMVTRSKKRNFAERTGGALQRVMDPNEDEVRAGAPTQ